MAKGKRTCSAISEALGQSHDKIYRTLSNEKVGSKARENMLKAAVDLSLSAKCFLIIDDTAISKIFSTKGLVVFYKPKGF